MQAQYIPYQQLSLFSSLIQDYLNEAAHLSDFYTYTPDLKGFEKKIAQYSFKGNREILVETLKKQYQNIELSTESAQNIEILKQTQTFTITTGHQLSLFTGPLYFIYKIASTIKLCKDLKAQFPDKNFVPIYWMATEDHDFEEINHTFLEDKKLHWDKKTTGAVGQISTEDIKAVVQEFQNLLGASTYATTLSDTISKAYLSHQNLSLATRFLVNELFGTYGLVILDADNRNLKKCFAPYISQDILQQKSVVTIEKTNLQLQKLGYKIQVQPREINFFYLDKNLRERIVFENEKYAVLHTSITFTNEEIQTEIENFPEKFSPNVVMRPLYQELILPNLAYIGGSGEIAYWLQLKNNFEQYKVDFPILIVRNSAIWVNLISQKHLQNIGLGLTDIFKPLQVLQNEFVQKNTKKELSIQTQKNQIHNLIAQIKHQSANINPTLPISADALNTKIEHLLQKFERKMLKGEKRVFEDGLRQIEKLKNRIFPNGGLQERKENFAVIYKNYGAEWISFLIDNFRPLAKELTLIFEPQTPKK